MPDASQWTKSKICIYICTHKQWVLILIEFYNLKLKSSYPYILYQHLRRFHSCSKQWLCSHLCRRRSRLNTFSLLHHKPECSPEQPAAFFSQYSYFPDENSLWALMFTAEITHPESLYQSVIIMLSSLNPRRLYRLFPAVRQTHTHTHACANTEKHSYTPSHASPPTHSSLWWVWAPCHDSRVISTLLLYAYVAIPHTAPLTKRLCWQTNQKAVPQGWELPRVLWPWLGSTSFKYKTKFTCVLSTSILLRFKLSPCVLFWCCKDPIKCL